MTNHVAHLDNENQTNKMVNGSLTAVLERYKERVTIFEQRLNVDLNKRKKLIDSQMDDLIRDRYAKLAAFWQEIDTLKETLSNLVKENGSSSKTLTVFKTESKEKESKYIDKEIVLEKQNKELENIICKMYRSTQAMHMLTKPQVFYDDTHKQALGYQNPFHLKKAQRIQPTLYDGSVITKEHAVISVFDDEETLILKEESRSKMLDKQNDQRFLQLIIQNEITEVQTIFDQMEAVVDQCYVDKNAFEIKIKQLSIDKDQLLNQIMSQDIVHIAVNSLDICDVNKSRVNECTQRPIGRNRKDTVVKQKEHCDSLIAQINAKSVENSDLNAQLQEKVFSEIGYSWKPTSKTFTIVGNKCSLTRITSTRVVPTKETSTKSVATPTQGILVYSKKPKETRSVGSSSKVKIVESKTSNSKEPKPSWGSTVSDVPFFLWYLDSSCSKNMTSNHSQLINFVSKFFGTVRFGNDHIAKIKGYKDYQMGNVTIS
ncbi:hypothetical protein Tco_0840861 [Tanacetum coccineum]|uniref:Retrovirus-related Pol polyprotein from transposon TNT 1-94-like beta-barrel domain-containing protein n=1 Tax=Tanacetum coccineum TaxID=301880 RepID=A0ABQ5B0F7_9ASTR